VGAQFGNEVFQDVTAPRWPQVCCALHLRGRKPRNRNSRCWLVLAAVIAEKTNSTTLLGAQIFLYARIVYALVYIAGIPWLRTGVWTVSVVGLAMIFLQLI